MLKGKGIWINVIKECDGGDLDMIVSKLTQMGASYALVKVTEGYSGFNYTDGMDLARLLYPKMVESGIEMVAWGAQYGDAFGAGNWKREADRIIKRMNEDFPGVKAYILDIEGRWKNQPASIATSLVEELTNGLSLDVALGFSSYRYPDLHPEIAYSAFLSHCQINMPQVYWVGQHNPAQQLQKCIDQYDAIGYGPDGGAIEFVPAAPAYNRPTLNPPWTQTPQDIRAFHAAVIDDHHLKSHTWWDYAHIRSAGFLPTIQSMVFPEPDPVDPGIHIHNQYANRQHDHVDTNKQLADLRKNTDERIKAQAGAINFLGETLNLRIDNMNHEAINKVGELEARIQVMEMKISFWNWIRKIFGKVADEDPE